MGDSRVLEQGECDVLHKANSGALRFKVQFPDNNMSPSFSFHDIDDPHRELCRVTVGRLFRIKNKSGQRDMETKKITNYGHTQGREYWVTWYSGKMEIGSVGDSKPFISHRMDTDKMIGFVKFETLWRFYNVYWTIEEPLVLKRPTIKILDEDLAWCRVVDDQLPHKALIGGYEKEPIYVARAHLNQSLCPGKYVPATGIAYIPWGRRAYSTRDFEVLCGYNAQWVKTKSNCIPPDAFVAGYSELHGEPLYIGRGKLKGFLVVGKVYASFKCCYLPFAGIEYAVNEYEILTVPKVANYVT